MSKVNAHRKRRSSFQLEDDHASGLSSEQIWTTLNDLLLISAGPVFEYTEFGVDLSLSLISASMDKRRKVSIFSSEDCRAVLTNALMFQSGKDILQTMQRIGVERNLIVDPLLDCLSMNVLPGKMFDHSPFTNESLLRHLKQSLPYYLEFRKQVSKRFVKLAESLGSKNAWIKNQNGLVSDANEHTNNYMLSVFRAIDKFYPHRGTLASYVTSWMNNASGSLYSVYLGEAYVVPRSHRRSLAEEGSEQFGNFSLPLEEAEDVEHKEEKEDSTDNIRMFEAAYRISFLFPAMIESDFPAVLLPEDIGNLLTTNSISFVPPDISKHLLSRHHVELASENLNFIQKIDKRRKK
jgi:hypothetical protein